MHSASSVASEQGISSQGLGHENQVAGHAVALQAGNQFAVQPQIHSQFQHYQSVPNISSYLTNVVPSNTQMLDSTSSVVHQV
uniref:Uncharacterized protein n=1 Tax=Rhizophora mucronata TaxID=61149 RepID=A0A2P2PJY4_RHIMU